ncbi:DUF3344 domain-containing protein [Methanolacinia paynteri]|uniref:DUF3344 domain-containing protein n=1 Tax=Methanolacinia paynteri TaxID=230356 RepID=UPI00064E5754|nr:DUF3344 domain-containing protein [Methanolacinia paynteri]
MTVFDRGGKMRENTMELKKTYLTACILGVILCLLVVSPASADQYVGGEKPETIQSGIVSGDLWFDSYYGLSSGMSAEKTFKIPDYTEIQWARLYVVVYCGHMQNNYQGQATVSFDGGQGSRNIGSEKLNRGYVFEVDGGVTPVSVNGHCNRVTSDYLMWYDVTEKIKSRDVSAKVITDPLDDNFDGRIKLITLVVAYDDGDMDEVYYWVNQGHDVHSYKVEDESYIGKTGFSTKDLPDDFNIDSATLSVVHLASENGIYTFNEELLDTEPSTGSYSGYQQWDVTDSVNPGINSEMTYTRNLDIEGSGDSYLGAYYKIVLAFLTAKQGEMGISVESNPRGAEIYIDGEDQEKVTNSLINLPEGSYSVSVHKDFYYDPDPVYVDVDEGEIATVSFNLEPNSYEGKEFEVYKKGTVKGGVAIANASKYSGILKRGKSTKYSLDLSLPENSTVEYARLYIYSAESYNTSGKEDVVPEMEVRFGSRELDGEKSYRDLKVDGGYKYTIETTCYDVSRDVGGSGKYDLSIKNSGDNADDVFALYGSSLVVVYSNPDSPSASYWIAEGCDAIMASDEYEIDTEDGTTTVAFTGDSDSVTNGTLYVVSTGADGLDDEENRIIFNDYEAFDLLNAGSSDVSTVSLDVKPYLKSSKNELSIQSYLSGEKGDYMENRIAVLVLEHPDTSAAEEESYGYTGKELEVYDKGSLNGGVDVVNASSYTGLLNKGDSTEYSLDVSLPEGSEVENARLYLYSTWSHDTVEKEGVSPNIETEFSGKEISAEKSYRDRKGEGIYNYILETTCYNVSDEVEGPGKYSVSVKNTGGTDDAFALYGPSLVIVYSDPGSPLTSYWIAEGCDALLASDEFGTDTENCTTSVKFSGGVSSVASGTLYMISTAASGLEGDENRLVFNDYEGFNLLQGGSSDISTAVLDVGPYVRDSGNRLYVQSYVSGDKGDYMENRVAVLVLEHSGGTGMTEEAGDEEESGVLSPGQTSATYPLSLSGGRTGAEHIVFGNGTIVLLIYEGSSLTDSSGMPVDSIMIKKSDAGNFSWAYTIGPSGAKSDIPVLIEAAVPESGGSGDPELVYYDEESGKTGDTGSTYDGESGTLSARISELGTYAIVYSQGNSGSSDLIFPLNIIADVISSFLGGGESGAEIQAEPGANLNTTPANPTESVAEVSAKPEVIEIDPTLSDFEVRISSSPSSAKIFLDGNYTGKTTPAVFTLRGGDHLLELELEDFDPYSEKFLLSENTTLNADLQTGIKLVKERKYDGFLGVSDLEGIGGVYVTSYPDGATVYVNGYNTEMVTPCVFYGLKEGLNTIKVKKTNIEYSESSKKVWVDSGSVMPVSFDVLPSSGNSADIDSIEYDGYYFTINGHLPEYELPKVVSVGSSNGFITFYEDGKYLSHNIHAYSDKELNDIRPRDYRFGKIFVESDPDGAEIYVDGYDTGYSTPYAIDGLSDGAHYIEVSKPGHIRSGEEILLTPDEAEYDAKLKIDLESYIYGSLEVTSNPSGAKIYLYNRDTGKTTPYTFRYMDIGGIDVKVVGEESTETVEDVIINPLETTLCHVDLD